MESENVLLSGMAEALLDAALSNSQVEKGLIEKAETLITVHQLYVQLLYVGIIIDRIGQLPAYLTALDHIVDDMDLEDLADAPIQVKIRAISSLNQSIKTKVELVNSMMASKDAVGVLISQMKENFGGADDAEKGGSQLLESIKSKSPEERQKLLGGVIKLMEEQMGKVGNEDE